MRISTALTVISYLSPLAAIAQVLDTIATVEQAFQKAQIVPDVISSFNPIAVLSAVYVAPSSLTGVIFQAGGVLTTNETTNEPEFWLTYNDPSLLHESFVIALVDPDAPSPQNRSLSEIRHYVGGDFVISSNEPNGTARLTNSSAAIAEYISPGPPVGSDPHRYTILLYKQPENFTVTAAALIQPNSSFENFNISTFASSVGLGDPIAGTFFLEGPAGTIATPLGSASTSSATPMPSTISPAIVKQVFGNAGIVPDVTSIFNPVALLDVAYTGVSSPVYVTPGGNLTTLETVNIPSFWLTYTNASLVNETFVLAMVDPDAPTPSNTSLAEIRHLILGDLHLSGSASSGTALLVNSTPALSDYISPGPPNGSAPHRYTMLLYIQPSRFQETASALVNTSTPITGFNLSSFVETVGLGTPVAGTFFYEGPFNASASSSVSQNNGVPGLMMSNLCVGMKVAGSMIIGATLMMVQ